MIGMMEGNGRRGRPWREWMDDIRDWCQTDVHRLSLMTHDRETWKMIIKNALNTYEFFAYGSWWRWLCQILKVTEKILACCIWFSAVLSIMFQPVFSVFLFIYRTLNYQYHCHSVITKSRNMFMFLLLIKRILIDWLIESQWILTVFWI